MTGNSTEKQLARQGWIQTTVVCLVTLASVLGGYFKLEAKADVALSKAAEAEGKAQKVEDKTTTVDERTRVMENELVRIRTILDERLPKKGQ